MLSSLCKVNHVIVCYNQIFKEVKFQHRWVGNVQASLLTKKLLETDSAWEEINFW